MVNRLIDQRTFSGELDNADLTLREVPDDTDIFLQVLQGVHHPRIVYPEPAKHGCLASRERTSATARQPIARAGQTPRAGWGRRDDGATGHSHMAVEG